MGRREDNKARRRAAIAAAAAALFAEKGFAATRTRDIAAAAGIAEGTLFNYAASKEAVVVLLWKEQVSGLIEQGFAAAAERTEPEPALEALFAPLFAFYASDLELSRVFLQEVARAEDPDLRRLDELFVARLAMLLTPWAGMAALGAAMNVFAAYLFALMGMVGGRVEPSATPGLFAQLLRQQRAGW